MSVTTPSTQAVSDNIVAQIELKLNQTISLLPKSFIRVLAKTLAGVIIVLYKYAGFMFQQIFVSTATFEETEVNGRTLRPLVEWGRLVGIGDPAEATQAQLSVDITVLNQTGSLPAGTLVLGPNGVTYSTLTSVTLNAATVSVDIQAVGDQNDGDGSGVIGNLDDGTAVTFANSQANIDRTAFVTATVVTAADGESEEDYRQRVINRFQKRPQGGAYSDYADWGTSVAGIINIYPYTAADPGEVNVYAEATEASSGSADGIPTQAQLDAVDDAIQLNENGLASNRPIGALVNVFAITRSAFDVEVQGLIVDNETDVQAAIDVAITQYFLNVEPFITGLTVPQRTDRITKAAIIGVVEDVVTANGGVFSSIELSKTGVGIPIETYSVGEGEKAKLNGGAATYV